MTGIVVEPGPVCLLFEDRLLAEIDDKDSSAMLATKMHFATWKFAAVRATGMCEEYGS
jgi:hypothetical protein